MNAALALMHMQCGCAVLSKQQGTRTGSASLLNRMAADSELMLSCLALQV